ncbi:hypothetical protein P692DRAFT_20248340 [Suillus brevipes Sb2]|nr:hypothetical protein P692DRAFT_20248340 [Suillus brevipes Sb2]KAG2741670.1 hypothetical protein P692DRAFT_20248340 [Suillus brevipes Sb2]
MARSFCALALLCAYLAHRRSTLETQSQLHHWLLERRCGIIHGGCWTGFLLWIGCASVEHKGRYSPFLFLTDIFGRLIYSQ